ncbi:hypothetical protein EO776_15925 (plasmid) [Halorubrum ezzemoulense]|uniref:Uncharacterized protein n=1 Tax=Halorubrum ezzemoulense TaxID=337243 RepID=A0A481RKD6_HALEZ|nr:hypothetical protein EO776_15925 [Halorubrum ezzemoulense]
MYATAKAGNAQIKGGNERCADALRDGTVERGRLDDQVDDTEDRRRRYLVRAGGATSEIVGEREPAFQLAA